MASDTTDNAALDKQIEENGAPKRETCTKTSRLVLMQSTSKESRKYMRESNRVDVEIEC